MQLKQLLCFQAREKVLNVGTLRCGLVEGTDNLSIVSHDEVTSHDGYVITIVGFRKRSTILHFSLSISVHSIARSHGNHSSQSQLSVHFPLWIAIGRKLSCRIFLSPDYPIFPSPISKENDLAPILLEFRQRLSTA